MRQPLQILHLADDPRDTEIFHKSLEADGISCEFTRVDSQPAFLAFLEKDTADLIFADSSRPSFDGLSALKLARSIRPDIPVIILSGALGEEVAIDAFELGATPSRTSGCSAPPASFLMWVSPCDGKCS
jgi:CheY-like chemotaxis protein